jgi:hypothetical protein
MDSWQRELYDLWRTRLSRRRRIWLLPNPHPIPSRLPVCRGYTDRRGGGGGGGAKLYEGKSCESVSGSDEKHSGSRIVQILTQCCKEAANLTILNGTLVEAKIRTLILHRKKGSRASRPQPGCHY